MSTGGKNSKDFRRAEGAPLLGAAGSAAAGSLARPAFSFTALHKVAMVVAGVGILTASAQVSVPFYPVPLTMQTLAVLLLAGVLGPTLAASSVIGYLALGAMGAPVFHNGLGGLAVLAGPTAGYLVGFIPMALVMGLMIRWARKTGRDRAPEGDGAKIGLGGWKALAVLVAGTIVASAALYAVGVPWLAIFTGQDMATAVNAGLVPFVLGDILKAAVAIGAIRLGGDLLARRGLLPY